MGFQDYDVQMSKISLRQIIKTIHADLIGKDSHRGITLTYGWMANQIGHFALGFIPTVLLVSLGKTSTSSLLIVSGFWLAFEIYNAMSPLYKKEYKGNGTFKPHWLNLTFDTFTDLCFFWLGSSSYYFLVEGINPYFGYYIAGSLLIIIFSRYWFLTKLYQQNALLPYQFRLSQWNGFLRPIDTETIKGFLVNGSTQHHFIVFGEKGSGKTRLSVGIANEMAIRHKKSYYTTFSKWCSLINSSDHEIKNSTFTLWNWMESEILVIDDINPGEPVEANRYTAEDIPLFAMNQFGERNSKYLLGQSVIWVVGSTPERSSKDKWIQSLEKLGVPRNHISIIDLQE